MLSLIGLLSISKFKDIDAILKLISQAQKNKKFPISFIMPAKHQ